MSNDEERFDAALKSRATRHAAPAHLRAAVKAVVDDEDERRQPAGGNRLRRLFANVGWPSAAAGFAAGALCAMLAVAIHFHVGDEDKLADDIVTGHVRSLMSGHLADVASTDRHTVKPWFAGKLDYSPPVWNGGQGEFPLLGGRVDRIGGRAIAALVYKRHEHVINVFVWPANDLASTREFDNPRGFHVLRWSEGGMRYWAVSDVEAAELQKFREAVRTRAE